jgi:hypothetical protein
LKIEDISASRLLSGGTADVEIGRHGLTGSSQGYIVRVRSIRPNVYLWMDEGEKQ